MSDTIPVRGDDGIWPDMLHTTDYLHLAADLHVVVAGKTGEWQPKVRGYDDGAEIGVAFYDMTFAKKADASRIASAMLRRVKAMRKA